MSHITVGTSKQKTSKMGSFVATLWDGSKCMKTKTVGVESVGHEIAYETIDLWAEDMAKEHNCEYRRKTFEDMKARLQRSIDGVPKEKVIPQPPDLKSNLGNVKFFKMEIKRAFKVYSAEKILEVMKLGTELINELETERVKLAKNSGKAKTNIAKAMYLTWVDTGVDATIWCTDVAIINEFSRLKHEAEQNKSQQGEISL